MKIRTGLKFKVLDKTYKVYTRLGEGRWSCLSLNYNEPSFVVFSEKEIIEALNTN